MRIPLLLVLTSLIVQPGCSSDSCTEMGCTSSSLLSGEMPLPNGVVTVEACRNASCTRLENAAAESCKLTQGTPRIEVCFSPASATTQPIGVIVYYDPGAPALADGDVYTLKVTDAAGQSLVNFTGTASYQEHRPNGAGCDPACKSAELSF
jgi:hypothetical protein